MPTESCCRSICGWHTPTPHAYSRPIEGGTSGGCKAYGLEDIVAYITGSADQELLLRNEYLVTERMYRSHSVSLVIYW